MSPPRTPAASCRVSARQTAATKQRRGSCGTTSQGPRPLLYHHLDKIEGLHQPIPISKNREEADRAATQVCMGRATALTRRKLAHPRELQVEKFNGATAIALEKRCISQPIARKAKPGNPPGGENRSSWPIACTTSILNPRGSAHQPRPTQKTPRMQAVRGWPHAGRSGKGMPSIAGLLCGAYSTPASLRPTR